MSTLYRNNLSGTLSATAAVGATTLQSAGFANLPVVSSPDVMWITLDPEGTAGAPEIVQVTAHTAAATTVTVVRAQQSTSAREHLSGVAWSHALTRTDIDSFLKSVATGDIADSAVTTAKIADSNVTTAKIADANVTTSKIAADAIDGTKIADDAIDSEHYAAGSIDAEHIASDAVTTAKILDANVTTAKLAADAVTGAKIADDTIDSEHYAAGSIDAEHLALDSVTTAKILNDAVTTAKILDANVTEAKLDAATAAKLVDGWTSFTPTWTNVTVGSGTSVGYYKYLGGKLLAVWATFTYGSGSAVSGGVTLQLPDSNTWPGDNGPSMPMGVLNLTDAGSNTYVGFMRPSSTNLIELLCINVAGTYAIQTGLSSTIPFTWTTGDAISLHAIVKVA